MKLPVRLACVVLGLAGAVYGTASLTGAWLGTPPWWERWYSRGWSWDAEGRVIGVIERGSHPRDPWDAWISYTLIAAGLALIVVGVRRGRMIRTFASRPQRQEASIRAQADARNRALGRLRLRPRSRLACTVLGLTAATYGISTLTGGWLGPPPWWERGTTVVLPTRDFDRAYVVPVVREQGEGVGFAVLALGVALTAIGARSTSTRRSDASRPAAPREPAGS